MVWLFVGIQIHMMNQNAYAADSEDVFAALPTWATRVLRNGNHTAIFSRPKLMRQWGAISPKVQAISHAFSTPAFQLGNRNP
jgi:hypothetical protein